VDEEPVNLLTGLSGPVLAVTGVTVPWVGVLGVEPEPLGGGVVLMETRAVAGAKPVS